MKRPLVIHPFLFGVFPVLFLFSHNVGQVSFSQTLLPLAIVLGFTLLLILLAWLILRDNKKAGIVVSGFLVLFFSHGRVQDLLQIRQKYLFLVWGILFVCSIYFIVRTRRDLDHTTSVLNIVASSLVVISLVNIGHFKLKTGDFSYGIKYRENIEINTVSANSAGRLPDIYYIILDHYANASTLRDFYNFDNTEFINYLYNRGFYVGSESIANYLCTSQSLPASLNMEYINFLSENVGEESDDWKPLYAMLEDYKVWRFLKSKGYKFIHFGSYWNPTRKNKYADMNVNYHSMPEFLMLLYQTTMVHPIDAKLNITGFADYELEQWKRVMYKFDKLSKMPDIKGPIFVFAHMLVPHIPYVFDRNGNFLSKKESIQRSRKVNYIDQLIFTNKKVKVLIDKLLASSEVPPIIVLQADEGPFPQRYELDEKNFNWKQASKEELREKMRILNTYYLPNVDKSVLYPSITPVNSFRLIFNLYFNTNLELLPDESYAFVDHYHIYKFLNVTDKVRYD